MLFVVVMGTVECALGVDAQAPAYLVACATLLVMSCCTYLVEYHARRLDRSGW